MGSVLYIAAHPDDENTLLIAYLARDYRTAYLSVTRGDGACAWPGLWGKTGWRARRNCCRPPPDGGRQFFTRAIDFGLSKDYRETLNIWDKQEVLSDVVRVIREFRPDVIITRFSTVPGGTHGHHTAGGAGPGGVQTAGDPKAFPEQQLAPWQPVLVNGRDAIMRATYGWRSAVTIWCSVFRSVNSAGRSRAMHKTQGFDNFRGGGGGGPRTENFNCLPVNRQRTTSWMASTPRGAACRAVRRSESWPTNHVIQPQNPPASVEALLKLLKALVDLKPEPSRKNASCLIRFCKPASGCRL